jgi:hypothetical protein
MTCNVATDYASRDGRVASDDFFFAEQNARLVKDAEEYIARCFGAGCPLGICATVTWLILWSI